MLKLLDISEIYYMIQGLNSNNLLIEKVTEKVASKIHGPDEKKLKKYWRVGIEFSMKGKT